jgi:hypothetical protein
MESYQIKERLNLGLVLTFVSWIKHDSYPHETSFVRHDHDEVVNQEFLSKQNRIEIINHSKSSTILNH